MPVLRNEPFANWCRLRAGGPIAELLLPETPAEYQTMLRQYDGRMVLLGMGTNSLITSQGIERALITRRLRQLEQPSDDVLIAPAGLPLPAFCKQLRDDRRAGFARLGAIPGSIGGAICMNAGCLGANISDRLLWVETWRNGGVHRQRADQIDWQYRSSGIDAPVLRAAFDIRERGDERAIHAESRAYKHQIQDYQHPSLGSNFKNPPGHSAARTIDQLGLKGTRDGSMQVSPKHANFIINCSGGIGNPDDYLRLSDHIAAIVQERTGLHLQREVRHIQDIPA